eukprot:1437344-Rhodomonas_salina.4
MRAAVRDTGLGCRGRLVLRAGEETRGVKSPRAEQPKSVNAFRVSIKSLYVPPRACPGRTRPFCPSLPRTQGVPPILDDWNSTQCSKVSVFCLDFHPQMKARLLHPACREITPRTKLERPPLPFPVLRGTQLDLFLPLQNAVYVSFDCCEHGCLLLVDVICFDLPPQMPTRASEERNVDGAEHVVDGVHEQCIPREESPGCSQRGVLRDRDLVSRPIEIKERRSGNQPFRHRRPEVNSEGAGVRRCYRGKRASIHAHNRCLHRSAAHHSDSTHDGNHGALLQVLPHLRMLAIRLLVLDQAAGL